MHKMNQYTKELFKQNFSFENKEAGSSSIVNSAHLSDELKDHTMSVDPFSDLGGGGGGLSGPNQYPINGVSKAVVGTVLSVGKVYHIKYPCY